MAEKRRAGMRGKRKGEEGRKRNLEQYLVHICASNARTNPWDYLGIDPPRPLLREYH